VIGNDEIFGIECSFNTVESLELFAFAGATYDDASLDLVEIESVRRLAHGKPRKVGRIDGVGDLLLLQEVKKSGNGKIKQ